MSRSPPAPTSATSRRPRCRPTRWCSATPQSSGSSTPDNPVRASSTVTVTVVPADDATNTPPAVPQTVVARVFAGGTLTVDLPLAGIDADGDWVTATSLVPPAAPLGRATLNGSGSLAYTALDSPGRRPAAVRGQRSPRRHRHRIRHRAGGADRRAGRPAGRARPDRVGAAGLDDPGGPAAERARPVRQLVRLADPAFDAPADLPVAVDGGRAADHRPRCGDRAVAAVPGGQRQRPGRLRSDPADGQRIGPSVTAAGRRRVRTADRPRQGGGDRRRRRVLAHRQPDRSAERARPVRRADLRRYRAGRGGDHRADHAGRPPTGDRLPGQRSGRRHRDRLPGRPAQVATGGAAAHRGQGPDRGRRGHQRAGPARRLRGRRGRPAATRQRTGTALDPGHRLGGVGHRGPARRTHGRRRTSRALRADRRRSRAGSRGAAAGRTDHSAQRPTAEAGRHPASGGGRYRQQRRSGPADQHVRRHPAVVHQLSDGSRRPARPPRASR